ncbi:MAG: hypothetical protein JO273_03550 [Methylobacteriaceae bacterium]|nr:hypothetical protein [Methylobacteriaceae bacterium]
MSAMPAKCSLAILLARESSAAVIFRRGPSKQTCLVAWDRARDTFEVGQWFKGSVYPERGDLSPDGRWLVCFAGKFTGPFYTWTALSRPPYFTASALWPKGDTWGGGGFFLSNHELVLNHWFGGDKLADGFEMPSGLAVRPSDKAMNARIAAVLEGSPAAWRAGSGPRGIFERHNEHGAVLTAYRAPHAWANSLMGTEYRFSPAGSTAIELSNADWADFDQNGDLVFCQGGRLYRLPRKTSVSGTDTEAVVAVATCLIDLTDFKFSNVAAPYYGPPLDRTTRESRREAKKRRRQLARHPVE